MEEFAPLPFLPETLLFLAIAGLVVPLLQRLGANQVLAFLAIGVLVGPHGLGERAPGGAEWLRWVSFSRPEAAAALGELGVLFLMFAIGLEISTTRLWALRRWVGGAGGAQVALTALAVGAIALAFGNTASAALVLGFAFALSSTAVVVQLLAARHALGTPVGQAVFSVLLAQDLVVVPLLVLVDVLGREPGADAAASLAMALVKATLAVALIHLLGRRLIGPLFLAALRGHGPDVFVALVLLATLGIAALTWAAGLSLALGAFLAGVLLAETEYRHEVEVVIEPVRGLLLGLFFLAVGMSVDLRTLAAAPLLLPAAVLGLFVLKAVIAGAVLRAGGLVPGRAVEAGLLLGQGGEFAFVVVATATESGVLPAETGRFMVLVVALGMFATPAVAWGGRWLGDRLERSAWHERRRLRATAVADAPGLDALAGHVVLAGYGRVGRLLGELFTAQGVAWVAIDGDPMVAAEHHRGGLPVYFGNATRADLLQHVRVGQAAAVVLTMDDPVASLRALAALRRNHPGVPVMARARDAAHAAALRRAGATFVVSETLEAGLQLAATTLAALGVPDALVDQLVELEREQRTAAGRQRADRAGG